MFLQLHIVNKISIAVSILESVFELLFNFGTIVMTIIKKTHSSVKAKG